MRADAFRDQAVIVTGASTGIGQALARQLARRGAKVSIAARRADRLEEVATTCRALGSEVLVVPTDVSEEAQCKALVEKTVAAFGRLDMLINNAGWVVLSFGSVTERSECHGNLSLVGGDRISRSADG
jgi:NADP-dependent 3-hydroxy acid dehydrogenase YdfG